MHAQYATLHTQLDDEDYQRHILQGVSRTFALTIPQLPRPLLPVVSNAYLLCRIADTIEDDACMPAHQKREFTEKFIQVVAGQYEAEKFSRALFPLLAAETPDTQRDLIVNTASVINITHRFNHRQREALTHCVSVMARGMARYQDAESLHGVKDLADMEQYCYYVAGVVGEMLTELFCDYSDELDAQRSQLMPLSVSFGQALQMTNILKDIWEDHHRGACWLPRSLFLKYGMDITKKYPGRKNMGFQQGLQELVGIAHARLEDALRYTLMLPAHETGLRRFCFWALGMAALTLDNINKNPWFSSGEQVKISRRSVKGIILSSRLLTGSDSGLKWIFKLASRNLPVVRP